MKKRTESVFLEWTLLICLFGIAFFISSCGAMQKMEQSLRQTHIKAIKQQGVIDEKSLQEDEGFFFGSVVSHYYDKDGLPIPSDKARVSTPDFQIAQAQQVKRGSYLQTLGTKFKSSAISKIKILGSGLFPYIVFANRLPAGEYSIYKFFSPHEYWEKDIRFKVQPGVTTYIGSLHLDIYSAGGLGAIGNPRIKSIAFRVVDQQGKDLEIFKNNNPHLNSKITSYIMEEKI